MSQKITENWRMSTVAQKKKLFQMAIVGLEMWYQK
jgi:hypothetical protein